jgi:hypothetical protein
VKLSPEHEDELIRTILRDQVGVDPFHLTAILELTPLGVINSAWRNTVVENWHAEGRVYDGDLLRINSHSTWRMRELLFRWRAEMRFSPDSSSGVLDGIAFDDFRWLGGRIHRWMVNPSCRLPDGTRLRDLAGDDLADLDRDTDQALTAFVYQAEGPPSCLRRPSQVARGRRGVRRGS